VLSRSDREGSWRLFEQALRSDIADVQGGTTPEGIHLGAMAGTVDLVQRCYTGIDLRDGILWLNPRLPAGLSEIKLSVRYRAHWLALCITHDAARVTFQRGPSRAVQVGVLGEVHSFEPGDERTFAL
jgi:trehalose/maltose hydrolase-like predicted phosphorylase